MRTRFLFFAIVPALLLAGCAPGTTSSGITSSSNGGPAGRYIYVAKDMPALNGEILSGQILSFPATSIGTNVSPVATTTGPSSMFIQMICGDGNGNVYALYGDLVSPFSVYEYSASPNGVLTLTHSFTFTASSTVSSMAADKSGNVYLGMEDSTILAFTPTASGTVPPSFIFRGLYAWHMTTDQSGNLYAITDSGSGSTISVLSAGFTPTSAPSRIIACPGFYATDLTVDATGQIYVLGETTSSVPQILSFSPTAAGAAAPARIIAGAATGINYAGNIAIDAAGMLHVLQSAPNAGANTYLEFSSAANGNIAPAASFTDPVTYQAGASGLVIY